MSDQLRKKHGTIICALSYLIIFAAWFFAMGAIVILKIEKWPTPILIPFILFLAVFCTLPFYLIASGLIRSRCYIKKIKQKKASEMRSFLQSQRNQTEAAKTAQLNKLKQLRRRSEHRAVLLIFCALAGSVTAAVVFLDSLITALIIYQFSVAFMASGLSRLCFREVPYDASSDPDLLTRDDFPYLYELADRARNALGCQGDIAIVMNGDYNIGIAKLGNIYHIELGAALMAVYSEDELFAVLLHEFSHVSGDDQDSSAAEYHYLNWLQYGSPQSYLTGLTDLLFVYEDVVYQDEFDLYQYATSLQKEMQADSAMAGMQEAAASGLLKLFYSEQFLWEETARDTEPLFASAKAPVHVLSDQSASLLEQISIRANDWNRLIHKQLPAQSDSHPTTRMRLDALGITEYRLIEDQSCKAYTEERSRLISLADQRITRNLEEDYEENRRLQYLEPADTVRHWEENGKQILPYEYTNIIEALLQLGRVSDVLSVCDRAISELAPSASAYACLTKGRLLLRRFDDTGIPLIYQAIEQNQNFLEEGLEEIGYYHCLTGNKEALESYRERADELIQKKQDDYLPFGELTSKDQLSAETLPKDVLDPILSYISSIENGQLSRLWLVRKTLPDGQHAGIFIFQCKEGTQPDEQDAFYQKLFRYLDSLEEQFSLFCYEELRCKKFEKVTGSCIYRAAP